LIGDITSYSSYYVKVIVARIYCLRVTARDGPLGDQYLRAFQDNEKTIPTMLTTSQKLSTDVDARNVRNIVLMRPVNSMIEFKIQGLTLAGQFTGSITFIVAARRS
jgi:type I site-specific restriction endonuclease